MNIIIAGAGEVGYHLVLNLGKNESNITALDSDEEVLGRLRDETGVNVISGSCTDENVLKQANIKDADLFVAITNSDETNLLSCKMAKTLGVKRTICRVREVHFKDDENEKISLQNLGVDWVINPTKIVSDEVLRLIQAPNTIESRSFFDDEILVLGFNILSHCSLLHYDIDSINQDLKNEKIKSIAIQRNKVTTIVNPTTRLQEQDIIYFICPHNKLTFLRKKLGYLKDIGNNAPIFINGGGKIGFALARKLERQRKNVRIIERDIQRSYYISSFLKDTLVLNFDGTDYKNLYSEGVKNASYFIALTEKSEINIASCLLANELEVEKTICLVKQPEYLSILKQQTSILTAISPRLAIANYLTQFIFGNDVGSYFCLRDSKLEVLQITVHPLSPLVNKSIDDPMLNDSLVGLVKRRDNFLIPNDAKKFHSHDEVMIITHRVDREHIYELFTPNKTFPVNIHAD